VSSYIDPTHVVQECIFTFHLAVSGEACDQIQGLDVDYPAGSNSSYKEALSV
jgi:hypothetical protein